MYIADSHASLYYPDAEDASKVLKMSDLKLKGKKIYAFPAHKSYLSSVPNVSCVFLLSFYFYYVQCNDCDECLVVG